ncbi:Deoxyribonuclease-1 [Polyrhizophydium stewartii]|uniref:Deoxyribonuclease-1 n=1 Tax=Polyrhizophydium stewartii TaxID=2732419 RepID=A0ABR4NGC7_9FUNG|nr:Deoxyribonuclease-1 [Polyrhizophydium stewartii]
MPGSDPPRASVMAYNLRNCGRTKFNQHRDAIVAVLSAASVSVAIEVRDDSKDGQLLQDMLDALNGAAVRGGRGAGGGAHGGGRGRSPPRFTTADGIWRSPADAGGRYAAVASEPLGSSSRKERFVFFYRCNELVVKDARLVHECASVCDRVPMAVRFAWRARPKKQFTLISVHTRPQVAAEELVELHRALNLIDDAWRPSWRARIAKYLARGEKRNVGPILLGDFNAGSNFVTHKDRESHVLWRSPDLTWLVSDDVNTMSSHNGQAHDRIVVPSHHARFLEDARVNELRGVRGVTADALSDHLPLQLVVRCSNRTGR